MRKKRILLIDDEVGFTRLLKLNLEQLRDYEVRVENGPEQAVRAAREFHPDVVLLDVIMPRMIGNDVAERLRADAGLMKTPIIFLSAVCTRNANDEWNRAFAGFPYIAKPATVEEVIDRIERHLPDNGAERHNRTGVGSELCLNPPSSAGALNL
jgi:DNA-binding response OmpR family regulator